MTKSMWRNCCLSAFGNVFAKFSPDCVFCKSLSPPKRKFFDKPFSLFQALYLSILACNTFGICLHTILQFLVAFIFCSAFSHQDLLIVIWPSFTSSSLSARISLNLAPVNIKVDHRVFQKMLSTVLIKLLKVSISQKFFVFTMLMFFGIFT